VTLRRTRPMRHLGDALRRERGRWACARGEHAWDRKMPWPWPASNLFMRIDCTRPGCDVKIDAARLRDMPEELLRRWGLID
jgi:hypothetical protein